MVWVSAILTAVALTALVAVTASGFGPLRSARRSMERFDEVREATDRLRRGLDVLRERRRRLGGEGSDDRA